MAKTSGPEPDIELAQSLFEQLDQATRQGRGIVRDSYGHGEQAADRKSRQSARQPQFDHRIEYLVIAGTAQRGQRFRKTDVCAARHQREQHCRQDGNGKSGQQGSVAACDQRETPVQVPAKADGQGLG